MEEIYFAMLKVSQEEREIKGTGNELNALVVPTMPLRVFIIICAVLWLIQKLRFHLVRHFGGNNAQRKRQPPGPLGIPIFGYMPFFAYKPLERLRKLASSYGEICTIYLGGYRVVVLSSFYTIREAFKDGAFSGRPALKMLQVRNGGVHKGR
jgi:hypothetical protein